MAVLRLPPVRKVLGAILAGILTAPLAGAAPAAVTSLANPEVRFTVPDRPYVLLRRGPVEAVVVDNRAVDDEVLPKHRAGYHGIASLKHERQGRNLFVPSYSGLNFEHIHDGTPQPRAILFEPRNAPMELRHINAWTAELYQPPTPHWGLESVMRYELLADGVLELTFECIPRRLNYRNGYLGLFWASYIDRPESLDIHFRGTPETAPRAATEWIRGVTPKHGQLATHRARGDARSFVHDPAFPLELPFGFSHHRYAEPWFFGECRGMAFAQVFQATDQVLFSQSPSGGGDGCPAWDFQWFVEKPELDRRYQLKMRALYTPTAPREDLATQIRQAGRFEVTATNPATSAHGLAEKHSRIVPTEDRPNASQLKELRAEPTPPQAAREESLTTQSPTERMAAAQRTLQPFFEPPAEFSSDLGNYRSPLLFNDGSPVRRPAEWPRRRAELLRQWHQLMGDWPTVIDQPKVEILSESRGENLIQQRVRIEIAPGQTGEGWLLLPDAPGPHPAALVVYYEPETSVGLNPKQSHRDFGRQLAQRGFVTLSIGTPGGNAWKPDLGQAPCQPLSFHAYVAANCWQFLAQLPQVDRNRIGVVGHSYGGKWALFAAALWEKFACVAVSDPGIVFDETRSNVNYWEPWYLGLDPARTRKPGLPTAENPRTGAYAKMMATGRDLHELHALIAPRPFLVSGGAEDPLSRWPALNHTRAVNQFLGYTNRVAMTHREKHDPNEISNAQLCAFFEYFLAPEQ